MRFETLIALCVACVFAALCWQSGQLIVSAAGPNRLKDFKELLVAAERLESAEMLLSDKTDQNASTKRNDLLYQLAREVKSDHCNRHFDQMTKVADEYRIKAYNFVDDSKKSRNWLTNFIKIVGPIGGMKSLSKFDPFLNSITDRYESQEKGGQLSHDDVDCDVVRFQISGMHKILFVLQTDIKYLLTEEQQVLNQAIYEQLKSVKFVSSTNFYEFNELNERQQELLQHFYADRVNSLTTTIGEAIDHFYRPSEYIIGRLLDSCYTVLRYEPEWSQFERGYKDICPKSKSDPNAHLFEKQFKFDKYIETFTFCHNFLDAL